MEDAWQKVQRICHEALEHGPEARALFLDDVCGPDSEIRREVESLLAVAAQADRFLESRAPETTFRTTLNGRIGSYHIVEPLGVGGMGEVYRAHDGKLGRDVALKTLPREFALDARRLARLRREAQTLASLNHPNIATIHGLEETDDATYLVLELVEGETLRGPISLDKALEYLRQLADGVLAAHEKGIIHRDLKPANVKVTPEGRVKILDFGLAKDIWDREDGDDLRQSGASRIGTVAGGIVGTPAYMSPEQAQGNRVDQRTDIWAFGCLLYELLTGKRAFADCTVEDSRTALVEHQPDWRALPPGTPSKVRELLRRCLENDPEQRIANMKEVREAIEHAVAPFSRVLRWQLITVAAVALGVAVAAATWMRAARRPLMDRSAWVQLTEFPDPVSQPALSPDGRMLAFLRSPSTFFGVGQLYVKRLPDGEPRQLTNDSFAKTNPAFSPDGTRIVYTTLDSGFNWDTWVVPAQGGQPLSWRRNVSDLVWVGPTQVLYSERPRKAIVSSGEDLSGRHDVYLPPNDRGVARRPQASPDGKWVLLAELNAYGDWGPCRVVPIDGSSAGQQVGPTAAECTSGTWSPDGKWVYVTSKAGGQYHIWRQRFPDGDPQQLTSGPTEEEGIAIPPDGQSFVTAVTLQSASVWLHDRNGERQISRLEGNAAFARFTPDGRKVCYLVVKEPPSLVTSTMRDLGQLWVAELDSGRTEPLVPNFLVHDYDISPDGSQVVIEADDRAGKPRLWLVSIAERSSPRQIPNVEGRQAVFGPGGEIFFRHSEGQSGFVYRVRADGTGLRKAVAQPLLAVTGASPDGRWIEGWALSPGNRAPSVQLFSLTGGPPMIVGSNAWLRWSHDGRALWMEGGPVPDGKTYVIPLTRGEGVPPIPPGGFHSEAEVAHLPGARRLEVTGAPGPSPEVYAFDHRTIQRNLYRIPIP